MGRRTARFESVNGILPNLLRSLGLKKQYAGHLVSFYWEKIVGPDLARHIHPVRVSFETLFLYADSSVWANECMLMQTEILQKINSFVGEQCVKELRFSQGKREAAASEEAPVQEDMGRALRRVTLSAEERAQAAKVCGAAANEKLRQVMQRVYEKQLRLEKLEKQKEWHPCKSCSVLCPPEEEYCPSCARQHRQEVEAKIRSILLEIPWARYRDVYQYVPCSAELVNLQRASLLQQLAAKVKWGDTDSMEAKTLVMLYRSIPPEQLTEEKIQRALYALRGDLCCNDAAFKKKSFETLRKKRSQK